MIKPEQPERRFLTAAVQCLCAILALGVITFISYAIHLRLPSVTGLYLIVIVLLSRKGEFISSAIVSMIAVGLLDYYFAPPLFSFNIDEPSDWVAMVTFLTASAVVTRLVAQVRGLMQEQLRQSEAYLAEAQQLSHTGSFGWQVSAGQLRWSDETYRIFELERTSQPTVELILQRTHPEDAAPLKQVLERAAREGTDFECEHRLLMPDGRIKYLRVVAHVARDKAKEMHFIGAIMDITNTKQGEEALRRAQAELAHVTRRTTMGELTASIAHEVNQPLAGIVMNGNASLRWLAGEKPNLVEAREAMQRVIRDGERAGDVIARIRALFKRAGKVNEELDINEVILGVVGLMRIELQRNRIVLNFEPGADLPEVMGDRVQIQQVMLNLILNAIDAMKSTDERARQLVIKSRRHSEDQVCIEVRDSGVGLGQDGAERIFESFYSTKPEGLGMGLSISRSIVENHAGRLWASANEEFGTTFQFTLSARGMDGSKKHFDSEHHQPSATKSRQQ
jgi:signal transduction histidine kinase